MAIRSTSATAIATWPCTRRLKGGPTIVGEAVPPGRAALGKQRTLGQKVRLVHHQRKRVNGPAHAKSRESVQRNERRKRQRRSQIVSKTTARETIVPKTAVPETTDPPPAVVHQMVGLPGRGSLGGRESRRRRHAAERGRRAAVEVAAKDGRPATAAQEGARVATPRAAVPAAARVVRLAPLADHRVGAAARTVRVAARSSGSSGRPRTLGSRTG